MIGYFSIPYLLLAALVLWGMLNGGLDPLLAKLAQRWRRKRYHAAPNADPIQAAVDEHLATMSPHASLAVAIVTSAGVRHVFAGHLDGPGSPTPDLNTPFEIGSITKTFTAALLVAMQQQNLVKFDTPLDELLSPGNQLGKQIPSKVTLESLATHCSGLPRLPWGLPVLAGLYLTPKQPYRFIGDLVLMRWLRRRKIRYGARYRYSNLGYGVLGDVLARRVGVTYAEALQRFVLNPLDLAATDVAVDSACAQPHTAMGRPVPAWNLRALTPAGGVHSTLADMIRWLHANLAEQRPLDARLHTARENSGGRNRSVALAWHVDGEGDRRVVWHNGRTGGSSSVIAFAPAHGTGVVVLANNSAGVDALGLRLLHAISTTGAATDPSPLPTRIQTIAEI